MAAATLVSIVFGASTTLAAVRSNDVITRYFVGQFNGGEFPMAIDTCLPTSVIGDNFQMITCDTEEDVTYQTFDDAACETLILTTTTNASMTKTGLGSYFDFNCDNDAVDAYTEVEFSVGTCDTDTKVTMAAALDTCVANTGLVSVNPSHDGDLSDVDSISIYCNSEIAELQYYASPNKTYGVCISDVDDPSGNTTNFYQVRNATTTCGYMLTATGVNVYGRLVECTEDPVPTTVDTNMDDDDSVLKLSIIAGFISSLFVLLSM